MEDGRLLRWLVTVNEITGRSQQLLLLTAALPTAAAKRDRRRRPRRRRRWRSAALGGGGEWISAALSGGGEWISAKLERRRKMEIGGARRRRQTEGRRWYCSWRGRSSSLLLRPYGEENDQKENDQDARYWIPGCIGCFRFCERCFPITRELKPKWPKQTLVT